MFFDELYEDFDGAAEFGDAAFDDGAIPADPMEEDDDDGDQVYDFDDLDDGGGPARPVGPNGSPASSAARGSRSSQQGQAGPSSRKWRSGHIPAPPTFAGNVEDEPYCLRHYRRALRRWTTITKEFLPANEQALRALDALTGEAASKPPWSSKKWTTSATTRTMESSSSSTTSKSASVNASCSDAED